MPAKLTDFLKLIDLQRDLAQAQSAVDQMQREGGSPWFEHGPGPRLREAQSAYADLFKKITVDIATGDTTDAFDRRDMAIDLIVSVGDVDGEHHKQWLLDQVLRLLTGVDYDATVARIRDGREGPDTFGWDVGRAP